MSAPSAGDAGCCDVGGFAHDKLDWASQQAGNLAKRYLNADLNIVIRVGNAPRQHVAVIRRLLPADRANTTGPNPSSRLGKVEQPSVLTNIIQTIEGQQEWVPSIATLEIFDSHLIGFRKPLYAFVSSAVRFADRKVSVFHQTLAVSLGECRCKESEAGSDAVDSPCFCVDQSGNGPAWDNLQNLISSMKIFLGESHIWGIIKPSFDAIAEGVELGYGPINARLSV